jgi:SecD/SecF fusion protein
MNFLSVLAADAAKATEAITKAVDAAKTAAPDTAAKATETATATATKAAEAAPKIIEAATQATTKAVEATTNTAAPVVTKAADAVTTAGEAIISKAADATQAVASAAVKAQGSDLPVWWQGWGPILTFGVGMAVVFLLIYYVGTVLNEKKRKVGLLLSVLATTFAVLILNVQPMKKGIDLQGGNEFVVELSPGEDETGAQRIVTEQSVQQAIGILEKRLNPDGTKDLLTQPQGKDRIMIQMPGVKDTEVAEVRQKIEQVAKLEFRLVHPQSASKISELEANNGIEVGFERLPVKRPDVAGETADKQKRELEEWEREKAMLVTNRADLDGKNVTRAGARLDAQYGWVIDLSFDSEGGKIFGELTTKMSSSGDRLATIVDKEIISAVTSREPITGGSCFIYGSFTETSSRALASALENPLENPMKILSERSVSATYGQSSIDQGKLVCIAGFIITALFMLFIYRGAGLIAVVGLIVNITLLLGAMSLFQFTLTMPGIAGIVLTIGMAVDANVLIYERLREEIQAGRTLKEALAAAFEKAFTAIFDSNITTLISAWILYLLATGLVKGFAITLTMGIISSMFGALIVVRVIFMWLVDTDKMTTLNAARVIPEKIWDILSKAKGFIIASLLITAISFATIAFKGKNSLGIDFRGGALVYVDLQDGQDISEEEVTALAGEVKVKGDKEGEYKSLSRPIYQKTASANGTAIALRADDTAGAPLAEALQKKFADRIKGTTVETVGPVIGDELLRTSSIAISLALLAIFVYLMFRFEFSFALGAIVALFHDVLMVPGLCVLFGQEMSVIHLGALLTIAGYSINDTIVVFDRIRETIRDGGGGSIRQLMNEAICKTLSRTLLTGPTALAPMVMLLFMGNPAMKEFALPMVIGVLLGTYSSIFIASPLVLWLAERSKVDLKSQVKDAHDRAQALEAAIRNEKELAE